MRLFTGIALTDDVMDNLQRLIGLLRTTAHVRWSPVYNLHITTKFIGEWPGPRLDELKNALARVPDVPSFELNVRGFGWFPNPHSPRVLWVGIHGADSLKELAEATDEATAALGIEPEKKPYAPHLTLARVSEPVPLVNLKRAIAEMKSDDFGSFRVPSWNLYQSQPGPAGSIYTQLAEFPLLAK